MYKILLYEDNRDLRSSLSELLALEDDFEVVGAKENAENIEADLEALKPDMLLMDIDMPKITGIEAVKLVRAKDGAIPIMMLTVFDERTSVFEALAAGANGYLLKKHISARLISSIHDMLQGGAAMSPVIARMILQKTFGAGKSDDAYGLTPRETEVLQSLSDGNSYKMVADQLKVSIETVRSHIKHIYEKLHVNSQAEAIGKALREGLVK